MQRRYPLFEIDRIVNRTLVYASVTAILTGVLAAASAISQRVFIALTGEGSDVAVIITTLIVAALYTPVRKRVETVIDRRFRYEQRRFGGYTDELRRMSELLEPGRAAGRLAREALDETRATGDAVTDTAGNVTGSAGTWPQAVAVRVPIGDGMGPLREILIGARRDGRPHDEAMLAVLTRTAAEVARVLDVVAGRPVSADVAPAVAGEAASASPERQTALEPVAEV